MEPILFWLATQQDPQNDWLVGKIPYTMPHANGPHHACELSICALVILTNVQRAGVSR